MFFNSSINIKILNSYHLKLIALVTMLIDHIGIIFLDDEPILRIIGRISFILYAFMLVEGFYYTKNLNNYITKLTIWAFISEFAFDLAFTGKLINGEKQNIFFTLLISILGLTLFKSSKNFFIKLLVGLICLIVSVVLKFDYSWYGVGIIFMFYFLRSSWIIKFGSIEFSSLIATFKISGWQIFSFLGFIPIILYNGKQGRKIGDIYYSFYALHLLIFYILKYVI